MTTAPAGPVPAPVRMTVGELERIAHEGWPGLETDRLGDWLLRAGAGVSARANSALSDGDPGLSEEAAISAVEAWYAGRGLLPRFQIGYPDGASLPARGIDTALAARGWVTGDAMFVMTRSTEPATPPSATLRLSTHDSPTDGWLAVHDGGRVPSDTGLAVLTAAPAAYVTAYVQGEPVAAGRVVVARGWAGLTAIEVTPAARGRGFGRAMTSALLAEGASRGAASAYLQVVTTNTPAVGLYRDLGFTVHHRYHYRTPGGTP